MPLGWHWKMAERLLWRIFCLLKSKARTAESWVNHGTTSTVWNWRWGPRLASRRHRGAFKEPWMGGRCHQLAGLPCWRVSSGDTVVAPGRCTAPLGAMCEPQAPATPPRSRCPRPQHCPLLSPACPPDPSLPPWPLLLPAVTSALEKLCSYGLRPRHRFGTYPRGLILLPAISLYYILLFQF